jgi:hypothetical protein
MPKSMLALVREFLPHMLEQGDGAILTAQGGSTYIGAAIRDSAFHAELETAKAAGHPVWEMPVVDPEQLAGLLWTMHSTKGQREAIYP